MHFLNTSTKILPLWRFIHSSGVKKPTRTKPHLQSSDRSISLKCCPAAQDYEKGSPAPKCQSLHQNLTWQIAHAKVMGIFHFQCNKSFPVFVRFMDKILYLLHIREFSASGRDPHWERHIHALNL